MTEPKIEERPETLYAGITRRTSMQAIGEDIPPLLGDVFGSLGMAHINPDGPPLFRYTVINMPGDMEVVAAVPVAAPFAGDGDVLPGSLPAGRYVTAMHTGHPSELEAATGQLLDWAKAHGVTFASHDEADGEHWAGRAEFYLDSSDEQPDMTKWRTELALLIAE